MWQQSGATDDDGDSLIMTWEEALQYCETLVLAGYDDWRLPNIHELQSIVQYEKMNPPSIDTIFFPHKEWSIYWASTA
jgi:hypothetical protein